MASLGADGMAGAILVIVCVLLLMLAGMIAKRRGARPPNAAVMRAAPPELAAVIEQARMEIETLARRYAGIAFVTWIGAVEIDPRRLAFWIFAKTDAERDRLAADTALVERFREMVGFAGYPAEALPKIGFAFESKETVDRVWGGNFWMAMK